MNRILILLIIVLGAFSCSEKNDVLLGPNGDSGIETKVIRGTVILPEDSSLSFDELRVKSLIETASISSSGDYAIKLLVKQSFQILYFVDHLTAEPVFMGLYNPINDAIEISAASTVLSMALLNPMLVNVSLSRKAEYLDAIKENSGFKSLAEDVEQICMTEGSSLLYSSSHTIYQKLASLIKDAMESLAGINSYRTDETPEIDSGDDGSLKVRNYGKISYFCTIKQGADLVEYFSVKPNIEQAAYYWGLPPKVEIVEPNEISIYLEKGSYQVSLTKGFDFYTYETDEHNRLATHTNLFQGLLSIAEVAAGGFKIDAEEKTPELLYLTDQMVSRFAGNMIESDRHGLVLSFCELLNNNSELISELILGREASSVSSKYFELCSEILSGLQKSFRNMGYDEAVSSFFLSLIEATSSLNATVEAGDDSTVVSPPEYSPSAYFSYSPSVGAVNQKILFIADSYSGIENQDNLCYRWDWNGDGVWDTRWLPDQAAISHRFASPGKYRVTLQVRNSSMLTDSITRTVNIDAGLATVKRIRIIQDSEPWGSSSLTTILEQLGFAEGNDYGSYKIVNSVNITNVDFNPETDLVIISNDQSQDFYDSFAENQAWVYDFIYDGGVLFWGACDRGSEKGFMEDAGIVLPAGVSYRQSIDLRNFVNDFDLSIVAGLPSVLEYQYASHIGFYNLPENTTIYTHNSRDEATLLEFNLGKGWVMISGQPLEHQHKYAHTEINELLPRILSHLTGVRYAQPVSVYREASSTAHSGTTFLE